jgi:hypothetical protein
MLMFPSHGPIWHCLWLIIIISVIFFKKGNTISSVRIMLPVDFSQINQCKTDKITEMNFVCIIAIRLLIRIPDFPCIIL